MEHPESKITREVLERAFRVCVSMTRLALWSSDISSCLRFGGVGGRIGNDDIESGLKASSAYPSVVFAIGELIAVSLGAWAVAEGDVKIEEEWDNAVEDTEG